VIVSDKKIMRMKIIIAQSKRKLNEINCTTLKYTLLGK